MEYIEALRLQAPLNNSEDGGLKMSIKRPIVVAYANLEIKYQFSMSLI